MNFEVALSDAAQDVELPFYDGPAPFATLTYEQEMRIKQRAWQRFARGLNTGLDIAPLVAAPMPRHYRVTSRRRVRDFHGKMVMSLGDGSTPAEAALLEPESHKVIYDIVHQLIGRMDVLQHVIVRGTYDEHAVIFNVRTIDAGVVRTLRKWTNAIVKEVPQVKHAWVYVDPTSSRYYLEQDRPLLPVSSKKLLGATAWNQVVNGLAYQVGMFSFTQSNLDMVPDLMHAVKDALATPDEPAILVDLYSGYGLFSAMMADRYKEILAIDIDKTTIANAAYNVRRAGGQVRVIPSNITVRSLAAIGMPDDVPLDVILDPPRKATDPGVIQEVAGWNPRTVVEVFCSADEVGRSIREWKVCGYEVDSITGLDLFPGTDGIETVVSFRKEQPRPQEPERRSPAHRKTSR